MKFTIWNFFNHISNKSKQSKINCITVLVATMLQVGYAIKLNNIKTLKIQFSKKGLKVVKLKYVHILIKRPQ